MRPVVVIGGGLAGGATASRLAGAGTRVALLEREREPHEKVCGEFLSVEACQDLEALGLSPAALGGVPIDRVRVHRGVRSVEAPLPFVAWSLSRAVLDEALLRKAAETGAEILRGVRVTGIAGHTVRTSQGDYLAEQVMLATGKHDVRGWPRAAPTTREGYVGFKMHWRLPARACEELDHAIELFLFDQGYAGLQRLGARDANLCLVVKRRHFASLNNDWDTLLADLLRQPVFARRLADAQPLLPRPLTIANLPYGYVHQPRRRGDEASPSPVWRLGDQACMTASLSGDGMAGALCSARVAAQCMASGGDPDAYHRQIARLVGPQVRRAMLLQRASEVRPVLNAAMLAMRLCPSLLTAGASNTRLPQVRK